MSLLQAGMYMNAASDLLHGRLHSLLQSRPKVFLVDTSKADHHA